MGRGQKERKRDKKKSRERMRKGQIKRRKVKNGESGDDIPAQ